MQFRKIKVCVDLFYKNTFILILQIFCEKFQYFKDKKFWSKRKSGNPNGGSSFFTNFTGGLKFGHVENSKQISK